MVETSTVSLEPTISSPQSDLVAVMREASAAVAAALSAGNITQAEHDAAMASISNIGSGSVDVSAAIQSIMQLAQAATKPTAGGRSKDLMYEMLDAGRDEYRAAYNQILLDIETNRYLGSIAEAESVERAFSAMLAKDIEQPEVRQAITSLAMNSLRRQGVDVDTVTPEMIAAEVREVEVAYVAFETVRDRLVGDDAPFAGDAELQESLNDIRMFLLTTEEGREIIRMAYEREIPSDPAEREALRSLIISRSDSLLSERDERSAAAAASMDARDIGDGVDDSEAEQIEQQIESMSAVESRDVYAEIIADGCEDEVMSNITALATNAKDWDAFTQQEQEQMLAFTRENINAVQGIYVAASERRVEQLQNVSPENRDSLETGIRLVSANGTGDDEKLAVAELIVGRDQPVLALIERAAGSEVREESTRIAAQQVLSSMTDGSFLERLNIDVYEMADLRRASELLAYEGDPFGSNSVTEALGRRFLGETFLDQEFDDLRSIINSSDAELASKFGGSDNQLSRDEMWDMLIDSGIISERPTRADDEHHDRMRDVLDFNRQTRVYTKEDGEQITVNGAGQIDGQELYEALKIAQYLLENPEFKAAIEEQVGNGYELRDELGDGAIYYDTNLDGELNVYEAARALLDRGVTDPQNIRNDQMFDIGVGTTAATVENLQRAMEEQQSGRG